jgi:ABC-type transport system involved in multi-copper enzyme maturation permease subunit
MTDRPREWVGFSLRRVGALALNTLTESVRQKVFNILLVFALVVIAMASFFAQFSFAEQADLAALEQLKSVKDFCLGAISVCGMLIAVIGTAQLLPAELEQRTIYTILSKPVRRVEFLLGKFGGMLLLIAVSVALMAALFGVVLAFRYQTLGAEIVAGQEQLGTEEVRRLLGQVRASALDPDLLKGLLLIGLKLAVLAGITLFVSTFSTSMIFNVTVTFMVFLAGHLVGTAKELWEAQAAMRYLLAIIPDLSVFNVADDIILGNAVPWSHVGRVALYGGVYLAVVVAAAHFVFAEREI